MYINQQFFGPFKRTTSFILAVLFFLNPLNNIVFAAASEDTPWVYDEARVTSRSNVGGQAGDYKESYEISLPTGIGDLTPNLQLSYSSQAGGYGSYVGYGWNLSIPSIQRLNKNGIDQMYGADDFQSSLDGELIEVSVGEYIPRVEMSGFSKYSISSDVWTKYSHDGTQYYWRIKFWDNFEDEGGWSTSTATFSLATGTAETVPFTFATGGVQNLLYTYDSVGNITKILDSSETLLSATTTYGYDDLYRLTSASTTQASTTPYLRTYTYNSLGNLLTKSDVGSYTYVETDYANPHAATAINGVSQYYDNNGNLASTSAGDINTWNYHNQLTQSETDSSTVTYGYDHTGSRVFKDTGSTATVYPSSLYEVTGTSTKKHIYANGQLVATIESDTPAPKIYYAYSNHLGSTNVVLDEDGYITQELDYYPYGDTRIDNQYAGQSSDRQFTGHTYDESTGLTYMVARYYDSSKGQFISQDPANLDDPTQFVYDPQQLNTYSYARNNPLKYIDPDGQKVELASRPINVPVVGGLGAHAFVMITPDNPDALPRIDGVDDYSRVTLGGYTENIFGGELFKDVNRGSDFDVAREDYSGVQTISPPAGMSQAQFEAAIVGNYNASPSIVDDYSFLGNPALTGNHNSNNFATNLLTQSGVSVNSINNLNDNAWTAGLGRSVDPSAVSALSRGLSRLSSALSSLKNKTQKQDKESD